MTTKKTTMTTELRRCTGSARFGIEPHEAPTAEFPKQPSRKDGLGTMCTEHWRAYVKGLREARVVAAVEEGGPSSGEEVDAAQRELPPLERAPGERPGPFAWAATEPPRPASRHVGAPSRSWENRGRPATLSARRNSASLCRACEWLRVRRPRRRQTVPDPAVLDDLLLGERHAIEDVFSEAEAAAAILFKAGAIEQALAAWDVIIPAGHRLDYDVSDRGRDLELVRLGRRARCLAMFQRGTTSMPRISSATGTAWPARSPAATPVSPMPSTRAR